MPDSLTSTGLHSGSLHLPLPRVVETVFSAGVSQVTTLTDEGLYAATGTRIAFTQRFGGVSKAPFASLNLATHVGDNPDSVAENRRRLLASLGAEANLQSLVVPNQVHGTDIVVVKDAATAAADAASGADSVVCSMAKVPVLLCFADCVPVAFAAPDGSFAVAHSGWRGTLAGIAGMTLKKLADVAGCNPSSCNVYIGPHIGACCYTVSDELLNSFEQAFGTSCRSGDKLNLEAAVVVSLTRSGADPQRVVGCRSCTSCDNEKYYSYRAEGGVCGRHGAFAFKER